MNTSASEVYRWNREDSEKPPLDADRPMEDSPGKLIGGA
jgi:hypothetical protein